MKAGRWLWPIVRVAIGALYAYAGFMKLIEPPENFQAILSAYRLLPPAAVPALARLVPWLEWFSGMFLVFGYLPRAAAALICALSASFSALLAASLLTHKGLPPDCGCFGESGLHLTPPQALALDVVTLGLSLRLTFKKP